MDVTFRPLTQPAGNKQYVAIIETEEELLIKDEVSDPDDLYTSGGIYGPVETENPTEKPNKPFSLGNDPIKTFYVGSVTVLGLYLLYRILNKK